MPLLQEALRTRLLPVVSRVTWVDRPQMSALPAIVLQIISDPRPSHLKGHDGARMTRVQLDVFAETYRAARDMALAAIAAVKDPADVGGKIFGKTFIDGQRDLSEEVSGTLVHRQSVDLLVWHAGD